VKRSRSMACSEAGGGGVLRVKRSRSRAKRLSGVEGEAVEARACSEGEVVEACSVGGSVLWALTASKT
jgi:hypothetical protein